MSNLPTNLKEISTYRSELMGWSILWIMMLHFTFNQIAPLGFVAQYGFAGVEIFLFVSGLGLYYSLERDKDLGHFYKKRLFRIFPTYYIIGIIASLLLFHDDIPSYFFRYTTIGFWTGGIFWEWYIPSLIILYLLVPIFKLLLNKNILYIVTIIIICFGCSYCLIDSNHIDRAHFFLLYRIPAFLFGMVCALWIKEKRSTKYFLYVLIAGLPFFLYLFPQHHQVYNYKYFSLIFLLPLFILIFILISKYLKFLNPIISCIGKASLEIYLIQSIFFSAKIHGIVSVPSNWHDISTICLIITSALLGLLAHKLIDKIGIYRLL